MQAAFSAVVTPDVSALADTITYYGPSQSGQSVTRPASLPPAPKSRFASFDSGINAGSFIPTVVAPEPEFASSHETAVYIADSSTPLPSDSDTGVTTQQTPVDETIELVSEKRAAVVNTISAQPIPDPEVTEIAALSTAAGSSSETTFSFSNLVTILEEAHQASLDPEQNEETLNRIIHEVGLGRFVDESPDGLDRMITNGGSNMALGQRRRLAFARALFVGGKLAVLDEPTESLDEEGTAFVYSALIDMARRGKTIIAFSRNPKIVSAATLILDLDVKPTPKLVQNKPKVVKAEAPA